MTAQAATDVVELIDRRGVPCAMLVLDEGSGPAPLLTPRRATALIEAALAACLRRRVIDEGRGADAAPDHARD